MKILNYLYNALLKPKSSIEETERKELVCNILLLSVLFFIIILDILVAINYINSSNLYVGISPYLMLGITSSIVFLLYFSRIGYINSVSRIFIWILVACGTYGQIIWGADLPSIILLWSVIITASSILISTRYSFFISLYITFVTITLQSLAYYNILIPTQTWKIYSFKIDDAIEYSITFILIACISWVSNREIYKSFHKVKIAKEELQKERDSLEEKVIQRTSQLHEVQIEKINNMYQLVEFGRISSGLFHDLMTPLNSINLMVSQMQNQKFTDNPLSNQDTNTIAKYIDQCMHVSKRMIDYIHLARRQINQNTNTENINVHKEIKNTIYLLNSKVQKHKVVILLFCKKNITFRGSIVLFTHIITNLINNAIDSYEETELFKPTEDKKIIILCTRKNSWIQIKIKDNGSGIPQEIQPHVFNTFFTTKEKSGCGIGLSATKHTIEKYFNGTISFTSTKQTGTTFIIKLRKQSNTPVIYAQNSINSNPFPNPKIHDIRGTRSVGT